MRLRIPIENRLIVHERTCPACGLEWTFATELTITPPETLKGNSIFEYRYSVSRLKGRPIGSVTAGMLRREHGWIDAS